MTVEIRKLRVEAVIGILPEERTAPQIVLVDLSAEYPYDGNGFLDYAALAELIRRTLIEERFGLLEEALTILKERIFTEYPQIERLELRLGKPDILDNAHVFVSERWNRINAGSDTSSP